MLLTFHTLKLTWKKKLFFFLNQGICEFQSLFQSKPVFNCLFSVADIRNG